MRKFKAIDIWMLGCDTFVFVAFLEFTMAQVLIFMDHESWSILTSFWCTRFSILWENHWSIKTIPKKQKHALVRQRHQVNYDLKCRIDTMETIFILNNFDDHGFYYTGHSAGHPADKFWDFRHFLTMSYRPIFRFFSFGFIHKWKPQILDKKSNALVKSAWSPLILFLKHSFLAPSHQSLTGL